MLTRIRNAGRALLPTVEMPHSRMKESLANILKQEGYVADVTVEAGMPKTMKLKLKYNGKKSVIEGLRASANRACAIMSARRNPARAQRHGVW